MHARAHSLNCENTCNYNSVISLCNILMMYCVFCKWIILKSCVIHLPWNLMKVKTKMSLKSLLYFLNGRRVYCIEYLLKGVNLNVNTFPGRPKNTTPKRDILSTQIERVRYGVCVLLCKVNLQTIFHCLSSTIKNLVFHFHNSMKTPSSSFFPLVFFFICPNKIQAYFFYFNENFFILFIFFPVYSLFSSIHILFHSISYKIITKSHV